MPNKHKTELRNITHYMYIMYIMHWIQAISGYTKNFFTIEATSPTSLLGEGKTWTLIVGYLLSKYLGFYQTNSNLPRFTGVWPITSIVSWGLKGKKKTCGNIFCIVSIKYNQPFRKSIIWLSFDVMCDYSCFCLDEK